MPPLDANPGPLAGAGPIRQCAYLVHTLEQSVAWWTALGVGPFYVLSEQRMQGYVHKGRAVDPVLTLAFANSGDLQIELIVAHDDTASPFREPRDARRYGAHHLAWWVEDWPAWEQTAADAGWKPLTHGDGGGTAHFAYYDIGGPLLVEVMELNDLTRWMTTTVRDAHRDWDGTTDPLRNLL
jgi:hypothetical protein